MTFLGRKHGLELGFSLLEVMMGIILLALVFVGLSAYSGSQWKTLKKSGDLAEATQVGISTLEKELANFSDSATFAAAYQAASSTQTSTSVDTGTNAIYSVVVSRSRLPVSNNILLVRAAISWTGGHTAKVGVLAVKP